MLFDLPWVYYLSHVVRLKFDMLCSGLCDDIVVNFPQIFFPKLSLSVDLEFCNHLLFNYLLLILHMFRVTLLPLAPVVSCLDQKRLMQISHLGEHGYNEIDDRIRVSRD